MSYQAGLATSKLYKSVIDEVISSVREVFVDEGIDEQVMQELKQIWENKVLATKAVDTLSDHPPPPAAATSSGSHGRSQQSASQTASSNSAATNPSAASAAVNSNVQPQAQATSVVVAAPGLAATLDAAGAIAGGFPHLAGQQHIFQSGAGPAMVNFAAFQPGGVITTNTGQGLIMGLSASNIRYINAAQLPTIPAMQVNQNIAAQRRNPDGTRNGNLPQVDGPTGLSDDEDDFEDEDDPQETVDESADAGGVEEGEPLNSEDDVSNEDAEEMFDADNVVVCQYEKVTRTRNKWKFVLKDGVMNLDGKDYVFNRANGEAEF